MAFSGGNITQAQTTTDAVCPGETFDLSVDNSNATTIWQVSSDGITWTDSAGTQGLSMIVVSPPLVGRFYRALTIDNGCSIASEVMELRASNIFLDLGPDLDACVGSSVLVSPTVVTEGTPASVLWTSNGFTFADSSQLDQNLTSTTTDSAFLTISDTNGCSVSDTIVINAVPLAASDTLEWLYFGDRDTFFVFPTCIDTVSFELWGAPGADGQDSGGTGKAGSGGMGGYAAGDLLRELPKGDTVWVFIGGVNGFNGGGASGATISSEAGGNGGGATDIRYGGRDLSDRVAIAGGGGGGGGAPGGDQIIFGGNGLSGAGGSGGATGAVGGDSVAFGASGTSPIIVGSPSQNPASGGTGGGDAAAPGGVGGVSGCNNGGPGVASFGSSLESGGSGGGGALGPVSSGCNGEGAGGGGGGGGLGGGGGGGGQAATSPSNSFGAAGGGGGGSSSLGFINLGTVTATTPNENPQNGWIRICW